MIEAVNVLEWSLMEDDFRDKFLRGLKIRYCVFVEGEEFDRLCVGWLAAREAKELRLGIDIFSYCFVARKDRKPEFEIFRPWSWINRQTRVRHTKEADTKKSSIGKSIDMMCARDFFGPTGWLIYLRDGLGPV